MLARHFIPFPLYATRREINVSSLTMSGIEPTYRQLQGRNLREGNEVLWEGKFLKGKKEGRKMKVQHPTSI